MNVLIDTCIIIDALQSREPFNKDAEAVFLSVANRRCVGFLTANSITDIYYVCRCSKMVGMCIQPVFAKKSRILQFAFIEDHV